VIVRVSESLSHVIHIIYSCCRWVTSVCILYVGGLSLLSNLQHGWRVHVVVWSYYHGTVEKTRWTNRHA